MPLSSRPSAPAIPAVTGYGGPHFRFGAGETTPSPYDPTCSEADRRTDLGGWQMLPLQVWKRTVSGITCGPGLAPSFNRTGTRTVKSLAKNCVSRPKAGSRNLVALLSVTAPPAAATGLDSRLTS